MNLLNYILKYKFLFVISIFFTFVTTVTTVIQPIIIGKLLGTIFNRDFILNDTLKVIMIGLPVIIVWSFSKYLSSVSIMVMAQKIVKELRDTIFEKLTRVKPIAFKAKGSGEFISKLLNDVQVIENFISTGLLELVRNPLIIIGCIGLLIYTSLKLSLAILIVAPLFGVLLLISNYSKMIASHIQQRISEATSIMNESMIGIETIKSFSAEDEFRDRFKFTNDDYARSQIKFSKFGVLPVPLSDFFGAIAVIVVILFGAYEIKQNNLSFEIFTTFIATIFYMSQPIAILGSQYVIFQKTLVAVTRIRELLSLEEEKGLGKGICHLEDGSIQFKNVSFYYIPERFVLKNIQLEIKDKETIAIIGPSGSGKSTLVSLILGLYLPVRGNLIIGGIDIMDYNIREYRKNVSFVPQDIVLFSGTISYNISLGDSNITTEEIIEACKLANAHDFIISLPNGYETKLGEGGKQLSGGERQRISLARALVRKPKILILDEATSALDPISERLITSALKNIKGKQTLIIVAHKLSTLELADRIVIIESGEIKEVGTHKELLSRENLYSKYYSSFLSV